MALTEFTPSFLADLTRRAAASPRRRQHHNVHATHADPAQRLFNAIGVDSYIRPHRHLPDPKRELLIAVRGRFAAILFDDAGKPTRRVMFGTAASDCAGVELEPSQWHTVVALADGAILLEVKEGPFDASAAKEAAPWSPEEGVPDAIAYLELLRTWAIEA